MVSIRRSESAADTSFRPDSPSDSSFSSSGTTTNNSTSKMLTQRHSGRKPDLPDTLPSSSSSSILQQRRWTKNLIRKSMRKSTPYDYFKKCKIYWILALIVFLAVFVRLIPDTPATNHASATLQKAQPQQKILFLAGPHKTGSSTIQYDSKVISKFTENWTFIDPWSTKNDEFKVVKLGHEKHFAALSYVLRGQLNHPYFVNPPADREGIIEAYRQDILNNWNNGKSITVGTEETDFAVADYEDENGVSGDQFLDGLLSILPQNTKNVTEVIVAYRSPRAKHFLSLWKEVGVTRWNHTLQEFIFHSESYLHFHTIDIMPLVEKFLERGFKVVLVDIGGVKVKKLKMFQLLACHLMQEACDASTNVPLFLKSVLKSAELHSALYNDVNVRTEGVMNLNEEQIQKIEETMLRYDCGYKDAVFRNNLLNVIFDDTFSENMNNCDFTGTERLGRKELWKSIQRIADPVRAQKENMRKVVVLAGPHFSQTNFMNTISFHFAAILSNKWSYVAPKEMADIFSLTEPAYGSSLLFAMSGETDHPLFKKNIAQSTIYDIFHQEIGNQFENGSNIIFGSDEFDRITSKLYDGDVIFHKTTTLLSSLDYHVESSLQYETTVVIGYYTPRIHHLLLLWNELSNSSVDLTFQKFLKDASTVFHLHTVDPLALANKFLEKGVHVTVVDIAGQMSAQLEPFQVLACDIMQEACNDKQIPLFLDAHLKIHKEIDEMIRENEANIPSIDTLLMKSGITKTEMDRIENNLQDYDCNFQHLLRHDNLTVLYGTTFSANMKRCSSLDKSLIPSTRDLMWRLISTSSDFAAALNSISLSSIQH